MHGWPSTGVSTGRVTDLSPAVSVAASRTGLVTASDTAHSSGSGVVRGRAGGVAQGISETTAWPWKQKLSHSRFGAGTRTFGPCPRYGGDRAVLDVAASRCTNRPRKRKRPPKGSRPEQHCDALTWRSAS